LIKKKKENRFQKLYLKVNMIK